ncbi:MAG: hypothetical protein M0D55_16340 [Elusimicrobiota bacterium]|nr:MAG: hypothetical protein M0D55_16340 [Elusimicrobiota bacterium]
MRFVLVLALAAASSAAASEPSRLFDAHGCRSCHTIGERGEIPGPT